MLMVKAPYSSTTPAPGRAGTAMPAQAPLIAWLPLTAPARQRRKTAASAALNLPTHIIAANLQSAESPDQGMPMAARWRYGCRAWA